MALGFMFYDILFFVILLLSLIFYLYKNKNKLTKDGPLYLYKTKWGIKAINYIGTKYKKTLNVLQYVVIACGYLLVASMLYILGQSLYIYLRYPAVVKAIKAPPVLPLFPYFPEVFGLQNVFPSFPAVYFIVGILIVATVHEFSHGIFSKFSGLKIKSTGFAFFKYLPVFFGAFVEPDEKKMNKLPIRNQLAILASGTFANILVVVLSYIIMILIFFSLFTASGVIFNGYPLVQVDSSSIQNIEGNNILNMSNQQILNLINEKDIQNKRVGNYNLTEIKAENITLYVNLDSLETGLENYNKSFMITALLNSPAVKAGFPTLETLGASGVITEFNGVKIKSYNQFGEEINKYSPGDKVTVKIKLNNDNSEEKDYYVTIEGNPLNKSKPYLGISITHSEKTGMGKILSFFTSYKDENVYYSPENNKDLIIFINNFFWWLVMLNLAVALVNMLPLGILDGGRFFYLTVLSITKSEKIARKSFSAITYIIFIILILMMIRWFFSLF